MKTPWGLALMFVVAGAMHFVVPASYAAIVPRWLPNAPLLVLVSGVAEIALGLGVIPARTRRAAGRGLVALLVAVFPANVQMLVDAHASGAAWWMLALLWLRLPVQALLVAWVYGAAIRGAAPAPAAAGA